MSLKTPKSHSPLSPQTAANFALILIVVVINGIAVHRNSVAMHNTHARVVRAQHVLARAEQIFASLIDAESGVRGFALTGVDAYLKPFHSANGSLSEQFRDLQNSVADNLIQSENVQVLQEQATTRMEHLQQVVDARSEGGIDVATFAVENGDGSKSMDRIREVIRDLKFKERDMLRDRTSAADGMLSTILFFNTIGICLGLATSVIAWLLINRNVRKYRQAEIKAEDERENLLVTLTSIGDAVVVTDARGRIQLANRVAKELLGFSFDIVGKQLGDVFHIVDQFSRIPLKNPIDRVLASGTVVGLSNHTLLLCPDGREIPIEDNAAPIRNKSDRVTGVVLVFRNVSARWQFEKELLKRENRFRKMFETPLIGIAVGTADGRTLLEANDAYLGLIGYNRGDLSESKHGWAGVDSGQSPLDSTARTELRETGLCGPFEKVYTRSDGTVVPVLISSTKLMDDEDRIIIFVTDLTRAKTSEAALRDSENRFRILSESMPQMVWMALPDGQFDYINQTMVDFSGRSVDDLESWGWIELLHSDERQSIVDRWKVSLDQGQPFEEEHRLRQSTGEYRWHLTRARPMYDGNKRITRWVGTSTDIDDHKQIETLLKEEHQRKDQFLALLAHELRNPLAPLANAVQVFSRVQQDPVRTAELIAIMQRQIKQMTRLIDDLLDIARITQGRILLRRERIEAKTVVVAAVEAVQPWIKERSHQLQVTMPRESFWIDADPARLSQVLTNLLQNAAKYTEPGGRIEIITECVDGSVLFRVKDNGPGLSSSTLSRVFDLFMQAEQTLNRAHGGLGLGLTLVRALVELHGGEVSAYSQGLGFGSEFLVRLPMIKAPLEAVPNPAESKTKEQPKFPQLEVLVVDDVQASAKTLALMLTVLGANVDIANDGMTAIDKVTNGKFDVVFLDIAMPGMDGLEVVRRLRTDPNLDDLRLVALTGFGQETDRMRSLDAGFNEHLIKPTSINQLAEVLQRVMDAKKSDALSNPA